MIRSPVDIRDYAFHELTAPQQRQVEIHIAACFSCRLELDRLLMMQTALSSLPDEKIPQRLVFISDQAFEPSPWWRGWRVLLGAGPKLVFASAAMLSAAILLSPVWRAPRTPP